MMGNMVVAGFAGAMIPLLLKRMNIDPAIASSIFVTTFTDTCGFFLVLGLGSWILL
jgi:magnesium transporter